METEEGHEDISPNDSTEEVKENKYRNVRK